MSRRMSFEYPGVFKDEDIAPDKLKELIIMHGISWGLSALAVLLMLTLMNIPIYMHIEQVLAATLVFFSISVCSEYFEHKRQWFRMADLPDTRYGRILLACMFVLYPMFFVSEAMMLTEEYRRNPTLGVEPVILLIGGAFLKLED